MGERNACEREPLRGGRGRRCAQSVGLSDDRRGWRQRAQQQPHRINALLTNGQETHWPASAGAWNEERNKCQHVTVNLHWFLIVPAGAAQPRGADEPWQPSPPRRRRKLLLVPTSENNAAGSRGARHTQEAAGKGRGRRDGGCIFPSREGGVLEIELAGGPGGAEARGQRARRRAVSCCAAAAATPTATCKEIVVPLRLGRCALGRWRGGGPSRRRYPRPSPAARGRRAGGLAAAGHGGNRVAGVVARRGDGGSVRAARREADAVCGSCVLPPPPPAGAARVVLPSSPRLLKDEAKAVGGTAAPTGPSRPGAARRVVPERGFGLFVKEE